jgi:hypothetical protein
MSKLFFILLCCVGLLAPALSQEQPVPQEPTDTTVEQADSEEVPVGDTANQEDAADEEEASEDDADLDLQTYDENDDIFVPTEEIPSDEPIPFPSDI